MSLSLWQVKSAQLLLQQNPRMSEDRTYPVPAELADSATVNEAKYNEMYQRSVDDSDAFWAEQAEEMIDWFKPWDTVQEWDYHKAEIKWFDGAKLNVSYNCLDRHLETRADQTAIIWESDDPEESKHISYRELHDEVCRFSNALKGIGVKTVSYTHLTLPTKA